MRFRIITALIILFSSSLNAVFATHGKDGNEKISMSSTRREAPAAPTTPDLDAADDSGVNTDNVTNQTTNLTFTGTADPGVSVKLFDGASLLGTVTANAGTGAYTINVPLAAGSHSITAMANDGVADSPSSGALSVTIDTTVPTISLPDLDAADDTGISTDNITTTTANLTISGTTEANISVELFDGASSLGTTTANGAGAWTMDVPLAAGSHSITAVATDVAGNPSAASAVLSITVDTTAPGAPTTPNLSAADDSGPSNTDNITNVTSGLTFSGTAEASSSVELFDGATSLGTGTANGAGNWSIDLALSAGVYSITAKATDAAGNTSAASGALALVITGGAAAPSTPDLASADDTGTSNSDNITKNTTGLTFSGTSDANASIQLFNGATSLGTTTANGAGAWTINLALAQGTYSVTAVATNGGGDVSPSSGSVAVTIDTTAPTVSGPFSPADGAPAAASNTSFVITFNEDVTIQSPLTTNDEIYVIMEDTPSDVVTVTVDNNSADISISGNVATIVNSGSDLSLGETFYVNIQNSVFSDLAGNNYAGISDATTWNFVISSGASITVGTTTVCNDSYSTVSPITITETGGNNFAGPSGSSATIVLTLSDPDYRFNSSATITATPTSNKDITTISISKTTTSITLTVSFEGGNAQNEDDQIVISGIQVSNGGSNPSNIVKNASSTLSMQGITNGSTALATITLGAASAIPTFTVSEQAGDPPVDPTQTRFSTSSQAVNLISNPVGGTFSGNGVIYNYSTSTYTFNPSATGVNPAIPIICINSEVGKCPVSSQKDFEVFISNIGGLSSVYCANAAGSSMTVSNTYLNNQYGPGHYVKFFFKDPSSGYVEIPSPNNFFDPQASIYAASIANFGKVNIDFFVYNSSDILISIERGASVTIIAAPNVSVILPKSDFCENGIPVPIKGSPSPNASDVFSGPGVDNTSKTFDPADVPGGSLGSIISINYTYTDPSTGCSNLGSTPIIVYPQPSVVNPNNINRYFENVQAGVPATTFACQDQSFDYLALNDFEYKYNWYDNAGLTNLVASQVWFFRPTILTSTPGTTNYFVTQVENGCESPGLLVRATVQVAPIIDAGPSSLSICATDDITLLSLSPQVGGSATTGASYWVAARDKDRTVLADGQFFNNTTPVAGTAFYNSVTRYVPGPNDKINQSIYLHLVSNDPAGPCTVATDFVLITISPSPTAFAGNDMIHCANDKIFLNGTVNGANTATTVTWSVVPVGGTILSPALNNSEYVPSLSEKTTGATLTFTLTTNDPDDTGPCTASQDDVILTLNRESLIEAGPDDAVCADELVNLNASKPSGSSATSVSWSGGAGNFDDNTKLNPVYTPDPSEIGSVVMFKITSNDPDGAGVTGPCEIRVDSVSIRIKVEPDAPKVIVPDPYCVTPGSNGATAPLQAFGENIRWYDNVGNNPGSLRGTGQFFSSGITTSSDVIAKFLVTQTREGCESNVERDSIIVNPAPVPSFTIDNFCLRDTTIFDGSASSVTYNNGLSGSVVYWNWNFETGDEANQPVGFSKDDPINTITTKGTYEQPKHLYSQTGLYNPVLRVVTSHGCSNSIDAKTIRGNAFGIRIGHVPVASIAFKKFCEGDVTNLFSDAGPANVEASLAYEWDFADTASPDNTSTLKNPPHEFTTKGNYPVKLIITTPLDCVDSVVTAIPILPYITGDLPDDFPYVEDFEDADHGWVNQSIVSSADHDGLNSWQWNVPNGFNIQPTAANSKAWFTRVDSVGSYFNNERSVLYVPCLNVANLDRPLLSFNYWNNTDERNDGVYMEWAIPDANGNLNWQVLGDLNDGIEWYNRNFILGLTQPNGETIGQAVGQKGWSGNTVEWDTARFSLNAFKTVSKLQLRFVFGSNLENPDQAEVKLDGFALDNFRFSSRNRKVLVENFTDMTYSDNNDAFSAFQNTLADDEIVKLQYHTGLQEADPINDMNKADPSARVGFYGLTNSETSIPRAIIDGFSEGSFLSPIVATQVWTESNFERRTLIDAPFKLTIDTQLSTEPGMFKINTVIEALEDVPATDNLVFYVAVIEKDVDSYANILRKMLPSAAGTILPLAMAKGTIIRDTVTWFIQNESINIGNLGVICFIQDQNTKAVFQAEGLLSPGNLPSAVTGTEDSEWANKISLFPNPASSILNIVLPAAAHKNIPMNFSDTYGREVYKSTFLKGEQTKLINTKHLNAGLYILQFETATGVVRKKVMVVHD
jgi:hypothetical protein